MTSANQFTPLLYEEALKQPDKTAVVALKAHAGAVARIGEFSQLAYLDLSGNADINDFAFLKALPRLEQLHLDNMGLAAIPAEVVALEQLTTLFLGKNKIKDFSLLARLPRLVDLGLEELALKKIPDDVLALKGLTVLGLNGNEIRSISALKKLPALEALYVANNGLRQIPKELATLTRLKTLWIAQNYALTDWEIVAKLCGLEELWMSNAHEIKQLPEWIFSLSHLRALSLDIHWNAPPDPLVGLASIATLSELETLEISGASMTRLPDGMRALKRLRKATLKDNGKLADISALTDLPALRELDLSKCAIKIVPESFSTLKALEVLDLSHNDGLTDISGLRDLPALERLTLYGKLAALPASLGTLTALRVLKVSASASDVGFLQSLQNLEELYLADCRFKTLPPLKKLRELTLYREGPVGDDAYLAAYERLESLEVTQKSFALPPLPTVKRLSIGRIAKSLDLGALGSLGKLEELSIHRSDVLRELPVELAAARGLKTLTLEFLDGLTDLSVIGELRGLRTLRIAHCKRLSTLPAGLAALDALEVIELDTLAALQDIDILGQLPNLRVIELSQLDKLHTLPTSLANLNKLERVRLYYLDALEDISVLSRVHSLRQLECDCCDELPRKMLAAVRNAIGTRRGSPENAPSMTMTYAQFIASGHYKTLDAKEDATRSYRFPLWFDRPEVLRKAIDDFSWLDDYREHAELGPILRPDGGSALVPLAILDFGHEGCDTSRIDSYAEEIFLVDTADARNPVLIWGHDGAPTQLHACFDDFLASLRDFNLDG